MTEAPKQAVRTEFSGTSLPPEIQRKASIFSSYVQETPHSYESHAEIIRILHQGFVDHVYPPSSLESRGDPHSYDLLTDLRSARENMDKLFAVGEELWADWIQDESILAQTIDARIDVMEKCSKAVQEEFGSTKLWLLYGDWIQHCYDSVQDNPKHNGGSGLTEEDRLVGKEVFTWQLVLGTWERGAEDTMWMINNSHLVWNKYIAAVVQDLKSTRPRFSITQAKNLFEQRLRTPHADWDGTSNMFSSFISSYFNSDYEEIMVFCKRSSKTAKTQWKDREHLEEALQRTNEAGDLDAEYAAFAQYIIWEQTPRKRERLSFRLAVAIHQRAVLRFSSDPKLWEDHVMYMIDESLQGRTDESPLPALDRATRHCPWSGHLWSQYLLSSERQGQLFSETEEIKHKATNTGLLDVGGLEEVLKVHVAWCSYLRRRAFQTNSSDEDLDVAEMGIRSSIETLQELANKKNGEGSTPDPYFRLERIYIKYLSESGSWDSAREAFRGLIPKRGDSWDFWVRFYLWEMMCWGNFIQKSARKKTAPHYATAVLREAIQRPNLDWPEKMMETYLNHCQDHEDVEEVQRAVLEVKKRRDKKAPVAGDTTIQEDRIGVSGDILPDAEAQVHKRSVPNAAAGVMPHDLCVGKRKRDGTDNSPNKRSKPTDVGETAEGAKPETKRDRENATILVQHLPRDVSETRVRQFFRDCGTINSLKLLRQADEVEAVVEFDDRASALYAQVKDGKELERCTIKVQLGSGSTLFVANFPPAADETYVRSLFEKYGEIVEIRFPSLKYNTHRRFCYVQFKLNAHAQAATEMDGQDGGEDLQLVAKISNPLNKQGRSGAIEEGREVYVRDLDWSASEDDVGALFSKFGNVESVRIPRNLEGKSKGFAFVVFSTQEEANGALALKGEKYRSRTLQVEIATRNKPKRQAITHFAQIGRSMSPPSETNGTAASPPGMSTSSGGQDIVQTVGKRQSRTLALMNVPDTINDRRIRTITEPYGNLVKIVLRPDHQGAVVEYMDTGSAGRASLGLEGFEIASGRKIRIGTVPEMLRQKAETKVDRIQVGLAKKVSLQKTLQAQVPIRRPGQATGRRGGLGQKGGLGFAALNTKDGTTQDRRSGSGSGKNNDDFRALLDRQ